MARGDGGLSPPPDVLVVGAGPTGLALALQAHAHGAEVRVVERRPEQARPSRAMVVHPRTLESLRPLGVAEALLARGDRAPRGVLHLGRRDVAVRLGDVALGDTAYPHLTLLRQMDVEDVLAAALLERGVEVERGVELVGAAAVRGAEARARALLRSGDRLEEATCRFLAGCDGPASTVRRHAGLAWRGAPYREEVVLADVELEGDLAPGALHVGAGRSGLVFVFALGESATWRVLATRPSRAGAGDFGQPGGEVAAEEVQRLVAAGGLPGRVTGLSWSARVRLQHRVADSFRAGPLFLAGDAAHTHSPAAAQGMNTGILDAVNLGWKLALARSPSRYADLLDSYDQERRPVARQVLALTHLVFLAEASTNPVSSFLRGTIVPWAAPLLPMALGRQRLMAAVVRMLSQGWVRYRRSPLSLEGRPPGRGPRPGDRLPDQDVTCAGRPTRLHDLTASPGIHVLLERDALAPDLGSAAAPLAVHRIQSWPGEGLVAVRPDGHVGFRCGHADAAQLDSWLRLVGADPAPQAQPLTGRAR